MNNKIKGDIYELYILNYIKDTSNDNVWLWSHIPGEHLIEARLINNLDELRYNRKNFIEDKENNTNPLRDIGVDILRLSDNDIYTFVQCKNGYDKGIRIEDLAGFYGIMADRFTPKKYWKLSDNRKTTWHVIIFIQIKFQVY